MSEKIQVINSNDELEDFKPTLIKQKIIEETGLNEKQAELIKQSVVRRIQKQYPDKTISTETIRSLINNQLVERGFIKEELLSRKLGMSYNDRKNLRNNGCQDNANISYNPEMISKYSADSISKEYALLSMPEDCANAHINCYVHHHDLEYFNERPNCMNYDLRFFAKNGLKIDGKGIMGAVAGPAKSLRVLLNHMLQAWMAGAGVFSGGQGYVNFNTLLAPFAKGMSYKEIKQDIQGFIYNCNMSLVCRGNQVLFSSIGMDLSVPKVLANEPAISFGGVPIGTYKDYQEEADLIFKAVCEVINEKDYAGAYFRFPNVLFHIRDGDLDEYKGNCKLLHELGANNPTIYYVNCTEIDKTIMGCRTALPMNYACNYEDDCMNTGNFMYSTLNLPLIAIESSDEEEFYEKLNYYCNIIYKTLMFRRNEVVEAIYDLHMSDFLLQKDKETGKPLYDINRTTMTIGYCGLNEALLELYGENIIEVQDKGVEIVKFLNEKKVEFFNQDGLRWSVIASPAESTAHRFAEFNKKKYPNAVVQGIKDSYYLTNSHHIPVDYKDKLSLHIKNADAFQRLDMSGGGAILHLWLGEVWSDPEALWSLNKKIIETNTSFWAYSKIFTYCSECGFTINDGLDVCPICKSTDLITYDRITGYYLPTVGFNKGKKQEVKDRYRHKIGE